MALESLLSSKESERNLQHASKHTARADEVAPGLSAGSLATIVVFGTIVFVGGVAFLGLYLTRRKQRSKQSNKQDVSSLDHSYQDVEDSATTQRNKLQKKKKEWPLTFEATEIMSPIRHTALPQIPPLFTKQTSFGSFFGKLSPTKSTKTAKSWKQTTWIDEEDLHGPKMSDVRDVNGQPFSRDSWPLYTLTAPTMPTVTTEHVHPYYRGLYQQQQMARVTQAQIIAAQPYIPSAGPRQLPLPPRPALVTSNWVTSTMAPVGGYYSLQDLRNGRPVPTNVPQKIVPQATQTRSRSRSRSHSRHRPSRQSSTDSVLSEILKSTEQRLADRSPSKTRPGASSSKSGNTSSRETLLAKGDTPSEDTTSCQLCRSCSASPTKSNPEQPPLPTSSAMGHQRGGSESSALGHRRGGSDSSAVSEPDSLIDADFQMIPAGLTSPNRTPRSQGTPDHSPAASVSSGLPTLYSESEAEEDKAHEGSPLRPTIYQRPTGTQSTSRDNNDPFTSPPASPTRPITWRGLAQPHSHRKTTFGSGLQPASDPISPVALQSRYTSQLQGVATSSPSQQPGSHQAAYLNLLPLDLYTLCTPPRQTTGVRTPTIVSPDPETLVESVHPKKRMTGIFGTASSPPPVPSLPQQQQQQQQQQPPSPTQQPTTRPKAYPPPHTLKPKGSSPTLGSSYPSGATPTTTTTASSPVNAATTTTPKGPRPLAESPTPHSSAGKRHLLLSTPIRGPSIRLRAASTTSQSSSVYSTDNTLHPPMPSSSSSSQPSPPVVSTVAALRRMNSAVSNASGASDGSGTQNSPVLPHLNRFGSAGRGNVPPARRGRHRRGGNAGSRNYLGLLEVGKRAGSGKIEEIVVWDEKKGDRGKENKRDEEAEKGRKEWRESKDSLGLYDEDGFLISSPVRGGD
ncbi:hypothetical protein NKR19_g8263 [Coniochaeta hoffmannii]|uniref:Uncharacterized protein n=1 Tax=Coniochaeta hoffmannii TaxID=91930 RepID=A0AA38R774_9PEZI|nr:hypothetical protein NKR19_g8263 [Coniochaeta hoffmannii]